MQTISSMREYINEYVRSQPLYKTGYELLRDYFGIPFLHWDDGMGYDINHIPMSEDEAKEYIKNFFEELDTHAIIDLYNNIKV